MASNLLNCELCGNLLLENRGQHLQAKNKVTGKIVELCLRCYNQVDNLADSAQEKSAFTSEGKISKETLKIKDLLKVQTNRS